MNVNFVCIILLGSGEDWIQKRTGDRWLEVKKDLFREGGVRIPGGEENDPGSG